MFVPKRWMHAVTNIGDTVAIISEIGLAAGEGKKPEDFEYDPDEESSDDEWESEDESEDPRQKGRRGGGYRGPPRGYHETEEDFEEHPGYMYGYRERQGVPPPGYNAPVIPYDSEDEPEEFDSEDYDEEEEDSSDEEEFDSDLYPNLKRRGRFVMMDQPYRSE